MGIYPDMLELKRRNVSSYLQDFYLSPFSYIICTEDGSPGSWWLKNHLKKYKAYFTFGRSMMTLRLKK